MNFSGDNPSLISASYNVSSITNNGVGKFAINFTNPFPDVGYVMLGSSGNSGTTTSPRSIVFDAPPLTDKCTIRCIAGTSSAIDDELVTVAFFR